MNNSIKAKSLSFSYSNVKALDNVSFEIPENSITALVGKNGAGKTTLFKCLAGLLSPNNGQVIIGGTDIMDNPANAHQKIGYLQDFIGIYESLSVHQVLIYSAYSYGISSPKVEDMIQNTLERIKLTGKKNDRAGTLSRGMRQRLAIGQALIHNPKVLLLDEPASGLDPDARHKLHKLFLDLKKSGMTLFVSSHILSELDEYSDNLIILDQGKIINRKQQLDEDSHYISIQFISYPKDLIEKIKADESYSEIELVENQLKLKVKMGGRKKCAQLLKLLIDENCEIYHFSSEEPGIEEQYFKSLEMEK